MWAGGCAVNWVHFWTNWTYESQVKPVSALEVCVCQPGVRRLFAQNNVRIYGRVQIGTSKILNLWRVRSTLHGARRNSHHWNKMENKFLIWRLRKRVAVKWVAQRSKNKNTHSTTNGCGSFCLICPQLKTPASRLVVRGAESVDKQFTLF